MKSAKSAGRVMGILTLVQALVAATINFVLLDGDNRAARIFNQRGRESNADELSRASAARADGRLPSDPVGMVDSEGSRGSARGRTTNDE